MSFTCLNPYVALNLYTDFAGKKTLKIFSKSRINYSVQELKDKYGSDNVYVLNCGTCESCRRNKANDWAIRCELEAKEHKYNYFLTLTFDNAHIKYAGQDDLRAFLDRLEGTNDKRQFKYLACEELGELTERKHFHLVLFCDFEIDLKSPVKLGRFYHFHSNLISSLWPYGLHDITPFGVNCARYVAKYTAKDSKLYMSRNLGKTYFMKHYQDIINDGFKVYSNFGGRFNSKIPKCFEKWFDEINPELTKSYKDSVKKFGRYVEAELKRSYQLLRDDEAIFTRQNRIIEKGEKKRRL